MSTMVAMVVNPKISATIATVSILPLAAGYITRGIKGSQGPNTNMMKRIYGVKSFNFVAWI